MLIRETLTLCENCFYISIFLKLRFVFVELFIEQGEGEEDSDDGKWFKSEYSAVEPHSIDTHLIQTL